ncbi:SCO4848 family membrane protein [Nocardioides sp. SYSU D00038]|uniref:SCO4848 family membrane protein n=1 Tax=Nocardioides sp. SYSU D00038 TaxID=2812554 RepID=UPI001967D9D5|nr:hypothetical protein [Nocardioides sp. SYSU D00038]
MRLERRHGWFLVGVAVWNFVTWAMFARNLYDAHSSGEDRPRGYWIAHSVLICVNLVLGVAFLRLGRRVLRRG